MARKARNYAAEYAAREQRAQARGFSSYHEERSFREETKTERLQAAEQLGENVRTADPQMLMEYYENILVPSATQPEVTGTMRHDAIAFYIDQMGYTLDEAIDAMRELYGRSPNAE